MIPKIVSFAMRHPVRVVKAWLTFAARWWLWLKIMRGLRKLIKGHQMLDRQEAHVKQLREDVIAALAQRQVRHGHLRELRQRGNGAVDA